MLSDDNGNSAIVMRVTKKDLGDWCENGSKTGMQQRRSYHPVKFTASSMSTREREAAASKAKKVHSHLEKRPHQ